MNDYINTSEEEWVVQTPPLVRKSSNTNHISSTSLKLPSDSADKFFSEITKMDICNKFEEEWIVETPPICKPFQNNDETKTLPEKMALKSLPVNEISSINYDVNKKSENGKFENRTTLNKNVLADASEEEWIVDPHPLCNTNEASKAFEERDENSYCRPNQLGSCDRSYCSQTQFELDQINESNECNNPKSCMKFDEKNNADRNIHQKSFNRKAIHSWNQMRKSNENRFVNTPYKSAKSDKYEDDKRKWTPNIKAPEFVPQSTKNSQWKVNTEQISPPNNSTYSPFSLRDLLNYDMDLMPSEELEDYANVLKLRVLDKIWEFDPSNREELETLCQLNDGSLTDKNKKVISLRICTLVKRTFQNEPEYNQSRSHRHTVYCRLAD